MSNDNDNGVDGWHVAVVFNKENANGRIYMKESFEKAIPEMMEKISNGKFIGELDHIPVTQNQFRMGLGREVSLANISHMVNDAKVLDNAMYIKVQSLETPSGKVMKQLGQAGMFDQLSAKGMGFAMRGVGEVVDGIVRVDRIISFDLVTNDAFSDMKRQFESVMGRDLRMGNITPENADKIVGNIDDVNPEQ